jgi:hypothetical protein
MSKNILDFVPQEPLRSYDMKGIILHQCICKANMWKIVVGFEDYEISWYALDMECVNCGTRATAPTPIDKES